MHYALFCILTAKDRGGTSDQAGNWHTDGRTSGPNAGQVIQRIELLTLVDAYCLLVNLLTNNYDQHVIKK